MRVTPGIEADTHEKIATGHEGSKFGLPPGAAAAALRHAAGLAHLRPAGLHIHLGSQIAAVDTYLEAAAWLGASSPRGARRAARLTWAAACHRLHRRRPGAGVARRWRRRSRAGRALTAHGLPLPELMLEPGARSPARPG